MKHSVVVFLFIFSNSLFSQSPKWQIQPTDFTNDLHGIYFTDSLTGYICGENGLILKTTDGVNWVTQQTPTNQTLFDIKFANDTIGWACGDSGTIISTQNGGTNWEIVSENYLKPLVSLDIHEGANGNSIWVVGDSISALKKFNQNWVVYGLGMRSNFIIFRDDIVPNAIINDSVFLWEAYNYGTIWSYLWLFNNEQLAVTRLYKTEYGIWSNNFWFVGRNGTAHYCDMPFYGWPIYSSITPISSDLHSIAVDEYAHTVWAVGVNGRILLSNNEGLSYNLFESPTSETLNDIYFSGFNTGYTVGNNGMILVYKYNWVVSDESKDSEMKKMIFPNPATTNAYFDLGDYSDMQLSIYNSTGERKLFQSLPSSQTIDVSGLPSGIYVYLLTGKNGFKETGKIIIR